MTMLAAVASISAWGQGAASPQKAFDGYFECRTLAEHNTQDLIPSKESVDTLCYNLGVNNGLMLSGNGFFDSYGEINIFRFLTGLETAMENGGPVNEYVIDNEWAALFEISPYEMSSIFKRYLAARQQGHGISKAATDSTCYLLGVNCGILIKQYEFFDSCDEINLTEILLGIEDGLKFGTPATGSEEDLEWASKFKSNPYQMVEIVNSFLTAKDHYKKEVNRLTEEYFLIINAKREGIKKTESGLQYIVRSQGEGDKPIVPDTVNVDYTCYLMDGTIIDEGQNMEFTLDKVIKGFQEGLGLIGKGGDMTIYVPHYLAYGENGTNGVEPYSLIIFDIKLHDFTHEAAENDAESE